MRIRRLKLTGFKSFVDPAELLIEPGLTGIVGPNGCGKSNLLEAIRWVMGEGSAKSLRGGGMEDVIFAGTAMRPARDFAEVAMLLDRDGREAEIVRRIERGAGSAYRIDGRDVRQKDVSLLFADAATGAHSPALVSQGRIGAIIAAKPADRRAMLEEAAGISGLHVRRRDAELKLRATETNLERLDTLIGDMEARANALRRQARAAERYRLLSAEIRLAEGRLIYARWRDAAQAADAAKREADAAEAMVGESADGQRRASEAAGLAGGRLAAARAAAQAARDRIGEAGHRLETLRAELAALHRRAAELSRLHETLDRDRAREGALAEDAASAIARLTGEAGTLAKQASEGEAARGGLASRLAEGEALLRDAEIALAQTLAAEASEQADARIARAALAAARLRLERADAETARIEQDSLSVGDAASSEAELAAATEAREEAEAAGVRAGEAIVAVEAARVTALADRDDAQSALAAARAESASLAAEAAALRRSMPREDRRVARAIDRAMPAPGYERALAAALGDDLEVPIGEGAVRWAGAAAADDPSLPAGCDPLDRHVAAPAELARRLAQIGVVDRDDGGIALAVGQRLVTRDGRMRRWDGFVAEERGAATAEALVRRNRLTEIEALIAPADAARSEAQERLDAMTRRLDAIEHEGRTAREAMARDDRIARDAATAEARARVAIERLESRRAELAARLAAAAGERATALAETRSAEAVVLALPDGSETARGVAAQRESTEAARSRVGKLRLDIGSLDRDILSSRDRAAAARAEAKGWQSRAGDAARRIAEMAARAAAAEAEAETLATAPAGVEQRIATAEADRAAALGDGETTAAAERAAEALLREAETVLAAAGEAAAEAREARATAIARHENHELRRIEMGRIAGERFQCPAAVLPDKAGFASADVGEAAAESARFERLTLDRERLGPVNLVAEQELSELETEAATQAAQRDELVEAVARLRGSIGSLNREGRARLLAAFKAVDGHFRRLFTRLFAGGEAHLALVDSDDPLEAGLEIMAQPPGKKLASLMLLSGGEQALTAVALIFALFLTNPAPICVLDEVDAPLDDANIERFCDLLDQMCVETDTRYLVVTHNAVSMARMHRLFGVTMIERGVSRLVSVDLGGAETLLAAE